VLHRGYSGFYGRVLSWEDIDHILSTFELEPDRVRLVDARREQPPSVPRSYDGGLDVDKLLSEYSSGASIVINGLHRTWKPVADLCRSLEHELTHPFQANLYLTPDGGRGLKPHFDTHDVFILQISGSKKWAIYSPPKLLPAESGGQFKLPEDAVPIKSLTLHSGDFLYLPRGFPHVADGDTHSAHLTVGMLSLKWRHAVLKAVNTACDEQAFLRAALPAGFTRSETTLARTTEQLEEMISHLPELVDARSALLEIVDDFIQHRHPLLDGHLTALTQPSPTLDSTFEPRPNIIFKLQTEDDCVVLRFHGKCVSFPQRVEEAVRSICGACPITVADVGGDLDDQGKLVLVRRLVHEGFGTIQSKPQDRPEAKTN
jgi:hypothetical protein